MICVSVGERIIELRKQNKVSQVQIAEALGISRQAVSKWENDLSVPDMNNLIRLADLLDTDTEYLVTGVQSKLKASPSVVHVVQKVDNIVEKVVERPVPVEKIVEVELVVVVEPVVVVDIVAAFVVVEFVVVAY